MFNLPSHLRAQSIGKKCPSRLSFKFAVPVLSMVLSLGLYSCKKTDEKDVPQVAATKYKVTIENVFPVKKYFTSGMFNTAVGGTKTGPIVGGQAFEFTFDAPIGSKLTFASMFGQSNDVFYAPKPSGINLYAEGKQVSGSITSEVYMWDAGKEVNQEPGVGADQAPRQASPNSGTAENNPVRLISNLNDGYTYPAVSAVLDIQLQALGDSRFKVVIKNISTPTTLITSVGAMPTPFSPGIFVIHTETAPIFTENVVVDNSGLESQAEDGNPASLATALMSNSGYSSPIAPGVWAVHSSAAKPIFMASAKDAGKGLEKLAEDASPAELANAIKITDGVKSSGIYNMAVGTSEAGPIRPGQKFEFEISATTGDYLSIASMLGESNDGFFAFSDMGISLYNADNTSITGDVSDKIYLWEAGTEKNEYPGAGANQAPRQSAPNTGNREEREIKRLSETNDGFVWPATLSGIKIMITPIK